MRRATLRRLVLGLMLLVGLALGLAICCIAYLVITTDTGGDPDVIRVQHDCVELHRSIERYVQHEKNSGNALPVTLRDLQHPPWEGPPVLGGGAERLRDPWGQPFQTELRRMPDGKAYLLIWTTTPDGVRISQFGIGPMSEPTFR